MFNWKFVDEIYLYDGTFEGLLTIAFDCYLSKELPFKIIPKDEYIPNILDKTKNFQTDFKKSDRIFLKKKIESSIKRFKCMLKNNRSKIFAILLLLLLLFLILFYVFSKIPRNLKIYFIDQTTPNMIQRISGIFEGNPLISKEI